MLFTINIGSDVLIYFQTCQPESENDTCLNTSVPVGWPGLGL